MKEAGVNLEVQLVVSEDNFDDAGSNWMVENLKFSVEQPVTMSKSMKEFAHV